MRPVHFEIFGDDPEKLIKFYQKLFGWKFEKWESGEMDYWLVMTGEKGTVGIDGGLGKRMAPKPEGDGINGSILTMNVSSFDEFSQMILDEGGTVQMPKTEVLKVGIMGYFKDPEGNVFGIMEFVPGAMESM